MTLQITVSLTDKGDQGPVIDDPVLTDLISDINFEASDLGLDRFDSEAIETLQQIAQDREYLDWSDCLQILRNQASRVSKTRSDILDSRIVSGMDFNKKFNLYKDRNERVDEYNRRAEQLISNLDKLYTESKGAGFNLKLDDILRESNPSLSISVDAQVVERAKVEYLETKAVCEMFENWLMPNENEVNSYRLALAVRNGRTTLQEGSHYVIKPRNPGSSLNRLYFTTEGVAFIEQNGVEFSGENSSSIEEPEEDFSEIQVDQETNPTGESWGKKAKNAREEFDRMRFLREGARYLEEFGNGNEMRATEQKRVVRNILVDPLDYMVKIVLEVVGNNADTENLKPSDIIRLYRDIEGENGPDYIRKIVNKKFSRRVKNNVIESIEGFKLFADQNPEVLDLEIDEYKEHITSLTRLNGTARIFVERLTTSENLLGLVALMTRLSKPSNPYSQSRIEGLFSRRLDADLATSNGALNEVLGFILELQDLESLIKSSENVAAGRIVAETQVRNEQSKNNNSALRLDSQVEVIRQTLGETLSSLIPILDVRRGQRSNLIVVALENAYKTASELGDQYQMARLEILKPLAVIIQACEEVGLDFEQLAEIADPNQEM